MSETLELLQKLVRELAEFSGWRSVAFELQFEPNLHEVFKWLHSAAVEDAFQWRPETKDELNTCLTRLGTPRGILKLPEAVGSSGLGGGGTLLWKLMVAFRYQSRGIGDCASKRSFRLKTALP
jgi:hypothetical protein